MKWILISQILACLLQEAYSYTCRYWDNWGHLRYLYCGAGNACCGSFHDRYCCHYTNVPAVVGGVIGFCIFVGIIATIVMCCCCACCPYSRRSRGTIITTAATPITATTVPDYQTTGTYNNPYNVKPDNAAYGAPPPAYSSEKIMD